MSTFDSCPSCSVWSGLIKPSLPLRSSAWPTLSTLPPLHAMFATTPDIAATEEWLYSSWLRDLPE